MALLAPVLFIRVHTQATLQAQVSDIVSDATTYVKALVSVDEAMKLFGFKRTTFYRFRAKHHVPVVLGRRVHVGDIISACEIERGKRNAYGPPLHATMADAKNYSTKLITLATAGRLFDLSTTSLWRLRIRHRVPLVAGGRVHADDIVAALDRERSR